MSFPEQNKTDFSVGITDFLAQYKITKGSKHAPKFKPVDKSDGAFELFSYQKLIGEYMSKDSPYRGLLVAAGLGSGKTITAINVAQKMGRKTVVLAAKSLQQNFMEEVIQFVPKYHRPSNFQELDRKEQLKIDKKLEKAIAKEYSFVTSNSGTSAQKLSMVGDLTTVDDEALGTFIKRNKSLDNKLLIIDEVHNLLVSMIDPNGKNGTKIFAMIMNAKNLRILAMSGSPVVSDPFELAVLFNMLRGYIHVKGTKEIFTAFPENYDIFNRHFVDRENNSIKNKNIFQDRIVGLVAYYQGARETDDREIFPYKHKLIPIKVNMSDYQWKLYVKYRRMEQDEERKIKFSKAKFVKMDNKKPGRPNNTTFRVKTRQVSDFALPPGFDKPKRRGEKESAINAAVKKLLNKIPKSDLTTNLNIYSRKMEIMLKKINESPGNVFVYSEFVSLEGIGIFSRVLEAHGWSNYNTAKKTGNKTFGMFSGDTSDAMRKEVLATFNHKDNMRGKNMKVLLASATAAEGLNLKNVRTVLIEEPYWHANRIDQIIGRAVRNKSHELLPKAEREVQSYIFLSVAPKDVNIKTTLEETITTDESIFRRAIKRQEMLKTFLTAMREMAIDCQLNYEHNKETVPQCRVCVPTNEPMFPLRVEDHLLPGGSKCSSEKVIATGLTNIEIGGKTYKKDEENNLYRELDDQPGVFIEDPEITKSYKKKLSSKK